MFFGPLPAKADFFSSIFGNSASASVDQDPSSTADQNSQNMNLLQSDVSSSSVIQDKNSKDTSSNTDINTNIVADNALDAVTSPLGVSDGTANDDPSSDQISVYVIRAGDTISEIAGMYGVSANTILWANNLKKGDKLVEGKILMILPVSGVKIVVAKGDTLKSIAKKYNADVSDIAGFNGITEDSQLAVGDELIIPDGIISDEGGSKPISDPAATALKNQQYYDTHHVPNLAGYFINPVPGAILSQGIHDNNAVDLAIAKGTPIRAAASGKVIFAQMGWNGAFGGLVIINHPNGTQTLYAHQSKIVAHAGDDVNQGDIIGYVGSTGHSTGPHLHFEVHGAKNPGADDSWK